MMTVQRREQAHILTSFFLFAVCVKLCEKNDATAQRGSANRTRSYTRKSNALQRSTRWETDSGSAGVCSPLAGARGVLASFPLSLPAAAGGTRITSE